MTFLVTGASGYVGAALIEHLLRSGHDVRASGRDEGRVRAAGVPASVPFVTGDVVAGTGLDEALDGVDAAFYLVHSMEGASADFSGDERRAAENFAAAARRAGTSRIVYLGGLVPHDKPLSRHLASRLGVEEVLLEAAPRAVAFRASIVIGARSRSFRFLVRLVERSPVLPLPAWHANRTQPLDGRDLLGYLEAAATSAAVQGPVSLDAVGPETLSYGDMVERIRDLMLVGRPALRLPITLTPVAARVASAIAGEDVALIEPLMESLESDLLARDRRCAETFPEVRLHGLDSAVEHALRRWELTEPLAAR